METRHLSLFRRLRTFSSTCQLLLQQNKGGKCEWCVRAPVRRFRIWSVYTERARCGKMYTSAKSLVCTQHPCHDPCSVHAARG